MPALTPKQYQLKQALDDAYVNINHIANELLESFDSEDMQAGVECVCEYRRGVNTHEIWDALSMGAKAQLIREIVEELADDEEVAS